MALTWLSKSVQAALVPKKSVIDVMKENLGGWKKARSHETVHASDITKPDFCPRQIALLDLHKKTKKDEWINAALQATFDVGNATGDLVAEEWGGQSIYGNWECRQCKHRTTFTLKPARQCKHGGWCNFKYEEVNFVSKEFDVSGSLDAIFDLGSVKLVVTEVKIIAVADFEKLVAPLAEHRIRTSLYLKLIEDSASPYRSKFNLQEGRVLYVSRGFGKKNVDYDAILPFKEFIVERNDDSVAPYLERAYAVKLFRETGVLPEPICSGPLDKPAKKCSVCKECWATKG